MSVITPNETALNWKADKREQAVQLYLSGAEGDAAELATARVAGFPVYLNILPTTDWINPDELSGAAAAVIQVDADSAASIKRFQKLAQSVETPLIAACYEPPLALVRSLIRSGAHDVLPLPLSIDDVETSLAPMTQRLSKRPDAKAATTAKLISVIKSVGGVGATALLTQLAIRFAENETAHGRETCVIDLDVQFGDVASALGLTPEYALPDVVSGPASQDTMVLKTFLTQHPTGLFAVCGAESPAAGDTVSAMDVTTLLAALAREFRYVVVDTAPGLSEQTLAALDRATDVIMLTSMDVPGVRGLRKELDVLRQLCMIPAGRHVVMNFADPKDGLSVRDVETTIGTGIDVVLPRSKAVPPSTNQGVPLLQSGIKDPMTKELRRLVSRFAATPIMTTTSRAKHRAAS